MSAARILVIASPTARRPEAGAFEHRHRRALAHGHGFAAVTVVAAQADRDVGHRHLPRSHHLIAADHSADRAIADGDQKGLVGNRRQAQQVDRATRRCVAPAVDSGARVLATDRTSRVMRGGLPSSTSIGMSTGVPAAAESVTSSRRRR